MKSDILDLIIETLENEVSRDTYVTHLNCGDGSLLEQVCRSQGLPFGVEPLAIKTKNPRIPVSHLPIYAEEIWERPCDLLILNPLELMHLTKLNQKTVLTQLKKVPKSLLYIYGDFTAGRSIFDCLHYLDLDFGKDHPENPLRVKRTTCNNDMEVILCHKA